MNNKLILAILILIFSQSCLADDAYGNLTIRVNGLLNDHGKVIANLFREGDEVMKIEKAYLHAQGTISDKQAVLIFQNLKYGKYAVSVFQDENDNGKLDHNMFSMPAEPLGFSNGFSLGLYSGLPSFEKLNFTFGLNRGTIDITVK